VRDRIGDVAWLSDALDRAGQALPSGSVVSRIGGALGAVASGVTNLFLVLFAGLYIAAQPGLYRHGLLKLIPPHERGRIDATLTRCGASLRNWLLGQLIAMIVVGVLTYGGLALLGAPSAVALGLFAGMAEFVPILGPIAAAIPALIIALSQDTKLALWVLALFVAIQGNLLQPIIQRKMVALPPAVALFAVIALPWCWSRICMYPRSKRISRTGRAQTDRGRGGFPHLVTGRAPSVGAFCAVGASCVVGALGAAATSSRCKSSGEPRELRNTMQAAPFAIRSAQSLLAASRVSVPTRTWKKPSVPRLRRTVRMIIGSRFSSRERYWRSIRA
jgi:hypothetical protein